MITANNIEINTYNIHLKNKLIQHNNRKIYVSFLCSFLNLSKEFIENNFYFVSDRGDFGEGPENIDIYVVNRYKEIPETFHFITIKRKFNLKQNVLTISPNIELNNKLKLEDISTAFYFELQNKYVFSEPEVAFINKETSYSQFVQFIFNSIKEEFSLIKKIKKYCGLRKNYNEFSYFTLERSVALYDENKDKTDIIFIKDIIVDSKNVETKRIQIKVNDSFDIDEQHYINLS